MRLRTLATAALTAALLTAPLAAQAAPRTHGVVECSPHRATSCVVSADNDSGRLVMRDSHRRYTVLRSERQALRYLTAHHYRPCAEEDSGSCYWNAGHRGNGIGASYVVIGPVSVFYLGNL